MASLSPTRLAVFLPNLEYGGAELALVNLLAALENLAVTIDHVCEPLLLVGSRHGALAKAVPQSIPIVELGFENLRAGFLPLRRALRRHRPDLLLTALPHANILALLASMPGDRPKIIVSEHGNVVSGLAEIGGVKGFALSSLMRWLYPRAAAVLAPSQGLAEEVRTFLGGRAHRVQVLPNPVLTPGWVRRSEEPVNHPWFRPAREAPVLLWAGRMAESKDLPTLVNAFAELRRRRPVRLALLGAGPEQPATEALASRLGLDGEIAFLGYQANPLAFMARADAFLFSSRWEGFGNVLVEAMACGLPVISTACDFGPKELVQDGQNGLLVSPGDAQGLAAATERVLDDSPLRDRLVAGGRATASSFRAERVAEVFRTIMTEVVSA